MRWRNGAMDGAELQVGPFSSLATESSRTETWTIHTTPEWTEIKSSRSQLKSEQWDTLTCPLFVILLLLSW